MQKLPALLVVGTVSGLLGAGVMWLLMREPRITGTAQSTPPSPPASAEPSRGRIGRPEKFKRDGKEEKPATAPDRAIPSSPTPFAKKESHSAEAPSAPAHSARSGSHGVENAIPDLAHIEAGVSVPHMTRTILPTEIAPRPGRVESALAFALQAASAYVKEGFTIRSDYWGGALMAKSRAITHQLFKGNEYWFWIASDHPASGIEVHIYDDNGNLTESEFWQRKNVAAARVKPRNSGRYFLIISKASRRGDPSPQTIHWAMAYGYR